MIKHMKKQKTSTSKVFRVDIEYVKKYSVEVFADNEVEARAIALDPTGWHVTKTSHSQDQRVIKVEEITNGK